MKNKHETPAKTISNKGVPVRISRTLIASEAVSSMEQAVSNEQMLLAFCAEPKSLTKICGHLGLKDRYDAKKKYINPLLGKTLRMTEPAPVPHK